MTVIVFLIVLSFLVFIHEAGHFLAAKLFGVRVTEFGFGYPPKAKSLFVKGGTEFTLNWLPFGGFVRLAGEEREEITGREKDKSLFYLRPMWQRIVVILAGAAVNFVFGAVAFSAIFSVLGIPETRPLENGILVSDVAAGSPAKEAGIELGDVLTAVNTQQGAVAIESLDGFVETVKSSEGQLVGLELLREEDVRQVEVYVRPAEEIPEGEGAIGVGITDRKTEFVTYAWWQMPFRGAVVGVQTAVGFGWLIVTTLGDMVRELVLQGVVPEDVAGPIRIVHTASQEGILTGGLMGVLNFAAILSVNLAIVNVLPVPALDGGRAVFILLEKALGKRFRPVYEQYANMVGFAFLIVLMVLISLRDVKIVLSELAGG